MFDAIGALLARMLPVPSDEHDGPHAVAVFASAPFATTSYARARLLRQLHASGALASAWRVEDPAQPAERC